jgi:hypothetical protein
MCSFMYKFHMGDLMKLIFIALFGNSKRIRALCGATFLLMLSSISIQVQADAKQSTASVGANKVGTSGDLAEPEKDIFAASPHSSSSKHSTKITDLQPPPWPLPPLDLSEREARLKFAMDTQNYAVAKARPPMSEPFCQDLLGKLKDPAAVHILEPTIVVHSRNDPNVPDNLIEHCSSKVAIDRVWLSDKKGPLMEGGNTVDSTFAALSLDQKDKVADFVVRKTGPIEFYDVSRFFGGKTTWGTFSEAGIGVCNNVQDSYCKPGTHEGYQWQSSATVGPVVDAKTCTPYLLPRVKAGGRMVVSNTLPYAFRELPNFYAYAEIDNDLYRLGLSGAVPWGDFSRLMQGGATTLIAERANGEGGLCMYQTSKQEKGR